MRPPALQLSIVLLSSAAALAGCGKSLPSEGQGRGASVATVAGTAQLGASGLATKNTTRLGGAGPVADAAAVALATYPGLTPATRPQAVVLVDDRNWTAALAAAALASAPLRAPLLYSEGNSLPALSAQALKTMRPTGAALLRGAQVIEIGTSAAPAGYRWVRASGAGADAGARAGAGLARDEQAALAAKVERLLAIVHGGPPHRAIVVGTDGPPALAMPAAGLAAEAGVPVLPVDAGGIPPATKRVLARLHRPVIYAMGPRAAVSDAVLAKLARLGSVRRIYPTPGTGGASGPGTNGEDPADNAIAAARYSDGPFGWAIDQPGHGLVFALASRPLDAPAAAPLSANGDYAPLLLLEHPNQVPPALSKYLGDIQPAYGDAPEYQPVRGAYNHGWLIGDDEALTPTVQAELDAMLEISPQSSTGSAGPTAPAGAEPSTTAPATGEPSTNEPNTPTP
jgi:hypothetical protein